MGEYMDMVWETPNTDLGQPNAIKYATKFYCILSGEGQLKIELIFDGKTKTFYASCPKRPSFVKVRTRHKGRRVKMRFSNTDKNKVIMKNPILLFDISED